MIYGNLPVSLASISHSLHKCQNKRLKPLTPGHLFTWNKTGISCATMRGLTTDIFSIVKLKLPVWVSQTIMLESNDTNAKYVSTLVNSITRCQESVSNETKPTRGRLNIKMPFYQYRDSHVKDKTVSSFTWESPYLRKTVFILRPGPVLYRHSYDSSAASTLSSIWWFALGRIVSDWLIKFPSYFHWKYIQPSLTIYLRREELSNCRCQMFSRVAVIILVSSCFINMTVKSEI